MAQNPIIIYRLGNGSLNKLELNYDSCLFVSAEGISSSNKSSVSLVYENDSWHLKPKKKIPIGAIDLDFRNHCKVANLENGTFSMIHFYRLGHLSDDGQEQKKADSFDIKWNPNSIIRTNARYVFNFEDNHFEKGDMQLVVINDMEAMKMFYELAYKDRQFAIMPDAKFKHIFSNSRHKAYKSIEYYLRSTSVWMRDQKVSLLEKTATLDELATLLKFEKPKTLLYES